MNGKRSKAFSGGWTHTLKPGNMDTVLDTETSVHTDPQTTQTIIQAHSWAMMSYMSHRFRNTFEHPTEKNI